MKRAEQLKRWQDSETFREPAEPKRKSRRIGFSDGCVFLAACAAGDKDEVKKLLGRGADIDTANVDGLTALHQACIDDNLEMVEFLVTNGADVNRGDNEGWSPLHATASCGFLSIAKYLLEHGANVAAVNNDGELAIDISESDEMEDLLQKEIDLRGIDCEESRNSEEHMMLEDAKSWYNSGVYGDVPHVKTGATALHVAAAKGYIKVMNMLIQTGAEVNQQDLDGWTALHAAAHWAQREACELLCENYVNMEIKNYVGQTPFDVADPDVLRLLEELKKKQANSQKDRPDIKALINRPAIVPVGMEKGGRRRSSITRLSYDDKRSLAKEDLTREGKVQETIKEGKVSPPGVVINHHESEKDTSSESESDDDTGCDRVTGVMALRKQPQHSPSVPSKNSRRHGESPSINVTDESGKEAPGYCPPHPETNQAKAGEEVASWRRPASLRGRPVTGGQLGQPTGKLSPSETDPITLRRAYSFESDEKFYAKLAELRQRIRATSMPTLNKDESLPPTPTPLIDSYSSSLPRPSKSNRLPSLIESQTLPRQASPTPYSSNSSKIMSPQPFRRSCDSPNTPSGRFSLPITHENAPCTNNQPSSWDQHDPWRKKSEDVLSKASPDVRPKSESNSRSLTGQPQLSQQLNNQQIRRSFVPPVRDEEHEIQRKAHAKRVRETRRSTQGVTLEDLKSAEQLVKKKQQQENALRTTELQQLASVNSPPGSTATTTTSYSTINLPTSPPGSTNTTTVTTTATIMANTGDQDRHERRPSWRLRVEEKGGERDNSNKFVLEDSTPARTPDSPDRRLSRLEVRSQQLSSSSTPSQQTPTTPTKPGDAESCGPSTTPTQLAIQRKKKPKRRSTGVVQIDFEDVEKSEVESADESVGEKSSSNHQGSTAKSNIKSQNGDIDYKKLWEESQGENARLRHDMNTIKEDLSSTRHQLDAAIQASTKNAVSDAEKREKKLLEKKLAEMEEELKTLEQLKSDNQRLRDENGALIRVISKLSK